MSQGNVEIVRRCYEIWDDRDWSAVPELLDPDFELDLSRNVFNPDVYHGRDGLERYVGAVRARFEQWTDVGPPHAVCRISRVSAANA
jgi:ketosteroid isomerase-like protein